MGHRSSWGLGHALGLEERPWPGGVEGVEQWNAGLLCLEGQRRQQVTGGDFHGIASG